MDSKCDLTVVILTKNEEKNLNRCIESVVDIAKRIVVVDSGSIDSTLEIAKSYGACIYSREFDNYANQFNWAIDNTNIETKWVFRFDADEQLTPELRREIVYELKKHES